MPSSLSVEDKSNPQLLPSLPPSPTTEEDLSSRARIWHEQDEVDDEETVVSHKKDKGKGKEIVEVYNDSGESGEASEEDGVERTGTYPPINQDAAETRKVEDTLRRWELAERQRRKTARESVAAQSSARSSLVGDVTRRVSVLWPGRSTHASRPSRTERSGLGNHTALNSDDSVNAVPMDDIERSPAGSLDITRDDLDTLDHNPSSNPFSHPSDPTSPFEDSAVMEGTSKPTTPSVHTENGKLAPPPKRPTLKVTASSFSKPPPPPQPLDLPPPLAPPPPNGEPASIAPPTIAITPQEVEEQKETRWWHDWLCGCSEGEDRGGDNQAGRTNPME